MHRKWIGHVFHWQIVLHTRDTLGDGIPGRAVLQPISVRLRRRDHHLAVLKSPSHGYADKVEAQQQKQNSQGHGGVLAIDHHQTDALLL